MLTNSTIRSCRVCGCTESDCSQCIDKTGSPCHWVAAELCSACTRVFVRVHMGGGTTWFGAAVWEMPGKVLARASCTMSAEAVAKRTAAKVFKSGDDEVELETQIQPQFNKPGFYLAKWKGAKGA